VLRQGNLNPEIEEKLLTLQRYQEKQAKGEFFDPTTFAASISTRGARTKPTSGYDSPDDSDDTEDDDDSDHSPKPSSRRRGANPDDDDEWVIDAPKKYIKKADREKMERKKDNLHFTPNDSSSRSTQSEQKIIVKTSESSSGQIRKNIIFCNNVENQNPVLNTFAVVNDGGEKSPEKALLASKLKMKAAQKSAGLSDEQMKHHKLQVTFRTSLCIMAF
jgi:hypothetical protein